MGVTERERLAPEVFRLPVEKIREGYYSDAYFNYAKALLELEDHHPRVLMQVFQRKDSILGGIDEAIAVLQQCAGRRGPDGSWVDGWDAARGPRAARGRRDRAVGDRDDDRGRLLAVRPPRDRLPRLLARRTLVMRNVREVVDAAAGKPILYFPARHDHWLVQTGDGWAAHVAGAIGVSTDAQASWWGGRGVGTVPHALIAAYGGDTVAAARAFARPLRRPDERHRAGRLRQRLGGDRARGRRGARRRPVGRAAGHLRHARRPRAAAPPRRRARPRASPPSSCTSCATRSTRTATRDVRIVVSGGFNADRIRAFEAAGVPVDAYGVGSSLIRGSNDFTADVVMVDGRPCAKVGRELRPNPRLEPRPLVGHQRHEAHALVRRALEAVVAAAQEHEPLVARVRPARPAARRRRAGRTARAARRPSRRRR